MFQILGFEKLNGCMKELASSYFKTWFCYVNPLTEVVVLVGHKIAIIFCLENGASQVKD